MNGPTGPRHGALLLTWIHSMEQTNQAQAAYRTAVDRDGHAEQKSDDLARAAHAEIMAGRAYLAARETHDPYCTKCGCTMLDGCGPIRCFWFSISPHICSNCALKETT
jgi:hypothetical protein